MTKVNGLEVSDIVKLVENVKSNPAGAQSTFYANSFWKSGFNVVAEVRDFKVGGSMPKHVKTFKLEGDHPKEFLGTDKGPSAVEVTLSALGHCIAGGWGVNGAALGVPLESVRIEVEGDLDPQGMLGLPEPGKVRPGLQKIRVTHYVKSSAPKDKLEQVKKMVEDLSPVKDSLRAINYSSKLIIE
ncbi:hypothetical protein A3A75_00715 [Candidatus Woesebacteria bacterium RIFCSPLOWO2_01_FULL_39_10]|uniref:OsmC family protein n=1 Tax=Candidatus Woesebacteria bacterium RIFCSPLOWO2_01_FULL_39_10 TaxID=1802516 RepID=A0A1F8B426_9BACT|nr:MAG: hypothetical protein A3A75_00715 [Candidatus Woesebacteria bacterium RIFCSPLOWO2_01_FULL_39_10]